jgi:ABC-type phosphate transport system permease subunit
MKIYKKNKNENIQKKNKNENIQKNNVHIYLCVCVCVCAHASVCVCVCVKERACRGLPTKYSSFFLLSKNFYW